MRIGEPEALDDEARRIIATARGAHEPNELNRARVRRGVEVKLAAGLGLALGPASSALAGAAKLSLAVATVGTVVGAGIYALPRQALHPAPIHASAPIAHRAPAPPPAEKPAAPAVAPAPRRRAHVAAPVDVTSALAQETALLGAANTALAHHDVASALALLDDYDHRGGTGILTEERAVTGILTLCAAGRDDAARSEARRFRGRWSRSPLAARVDGSCVGPARPARTAP
jgi:hypothetical protein